MVVRKIAPVGVVDEENAAGFEFRESGPGTNWAVPAVDNDKVE